MRKILISLLLASAAVTPATAGPRNPSDPQQTREERQQAREERQAARAEARSDRSAERPSFSAPTRVDVQPRQQLVERPQFSAGDRRQPRVDADQIRAQRESFGEMRAERAANRQERIEDRQEARELRQSTRPLPNVMRDRHPLIVSETPRPGTQPPLPTSIRRSSPTVQWNTNWRHNGRYDWQNYRHHHRSLFHLGFYYDPFGWGYSPFQIGWRLWPAYYSRNYWIDDPWMYRLPYAPPGYVWVRYWNDALLVDTWSGEVVDMIPGFFW
jgi:hypothetical protein